MKKAPHGTLYTHLILVLCLAVIVVVMNVLFKTTCPIRIIFGLECPFCGMTRAHIAALRLNFRAAFSYNPLFPLGIPYLLLILHETKLYGRFGRLYTVAVAVLTAVFVILFAQRLFG